MTQYKPTKEDKDLTSEILYFSKNMREEEFIEKISQMICDYRIEAFQKGFRNE